MPVQEFCTCVLSTAVLTLHGPLASDGHMTVAVMKLLNRIVALMHDTLPGDLWVEHSVANTLMAS